MFLFLSLLVLSVAAQPNCKASGTDPNNCSNVIYPLPLCRDSTNNLILLPFTTDTLFWLTNHYKPPSTTTKPPKGFFARFNPLFDSNTPSPPTTTKPQLLNPNAQTSNAAANTLTALHLTSEPLTSEPMTSEPMTSEPVNSSQMPPTNDTHPSSTTALNLLATNALLNANPDSLKQNLRRVDYRLDIVDHPSNTQSDNFPLNASSLALSDPNAPPEDPNAAPHLDATIHIQPSESGHFHPQFNSSLEAAIQYAELFGLHLDADNGPQTPPSPNAIPPNVLSPNALSINQGGPVVVTVENRPTPSSESANAAYDASSLSTAHDARSHLTVASEEMGKDFWRFLIQKNSVTTPPSAAPSANVSLTQDQNFETTFGQAPTDKATHFLSNDESHGIDFVISDIKKMAGLGHNQSLALSSFDQDNATSSHFSERLVRLASVLQDLKGDKSLSDSPGESLSGRRLASDNEVDLSAASERAVSERAASERAASGLTASERAASELTASALGVSELAASELAVSKGRSGFGMWLNVVVMSEMKSSHKGDRATAGMAILTNERLNQWKGFECSLSSEKLINAEWKSGEQWRLSPNLLSFQIPPESAARLMKSGQAVMAIRVDGLEQDEWDLWKGLSIGIGSLEIFGDAILA